MDKIKKSLKPMHWQVVELWLIVYDVLVVFLAYFLALWLRFDCQFNTIPVEYFDVYKRSIIWTALIYLVVFFVFKLYKSIWRFASYNELCRVVAALVIGLGLQMIMMKAGLGHMPVSYYVFGIALQFCATIGVRFSYRAILLFRGRNNTKELKKIMIVGAGEGGRSLLRDINHSYETSEKVCCFIDDNPNKWNRLIDGIKIVGGRDCIMEMVKKYGIEKIYVAIPSATPQERRDLLNICNECGCELKVLPGLFQLATGEVNVKDLKEVSVEDLLGREVITTNMEEIYRQIEGKVILVTGGGGSIGSELCRQIAMQNPKRLIIFDVYENSAYDIQQELRKKYPHLKLEVLIGSVRDSRRIFQVFETWHPDIVYHAAAHKHVPLMEDSPCEAIKNNAIGTYKTAYAALAHGCKRFVLISTDKAVNPTNIMGASKRLCEMIIQAFDAKIKKGEADQLPQLYIHPDGDGSEQATLTELVKQSQTEFVAVRFGNVLGSNGSVIPLFKKQIAAGGPVTVTHPDIIRYFMTIPEAVRLVLQAGTYARGGEIFVLDMGEPVKIDTLARNLIKLSGYTPDVDIKVEYCGLRPGEKLYEEKLMSEEGLRKTDNDLIHIGCPIPFDEELFLGQLESLMDAAYKNKEEIKSMVADMVSTYHPDHV